VLVSNDFLTWIIQESNKRGWQNSDLARHADISETTISRTLREERGPTLEFCRGIAQAFGMPAETILRMAGLLPSLPPEVEDEREVIGLYRRLDGPVRRSMVETMRSLLGIRVPRPAVAEERTEYEPQTVSERLDARLTQELAQLHPGDQKLVLELMERLRGDRRGAMRPDETPVSSEPIS
jgi:transcriptional regulator with XRE-family HTH domain